MTDTTAIEVASRTQLSITNEHMELAKKTVAKDLTEAEFAMFLHNCQRQGIHPLDGLLIPIKRNDTETGEKRMTFVTTADLLRSRAADTGEYAGSDDALFEHGADNKPISASVTVWRFVQGQKCSFAATARYAEYYPGDKMGFMWRSKPHVMLAKCAEGLALRKAFPKQLSGLYLEEEIQRDQAPRSTKAQQKAQGGVPGDVMCGKCRAVGGHLPSCEYHPSAQKGSPEATHAPSEAPVESSTPAPATIKTAMLIKDIKEMKKKDGKGYLMLNVVSPDNQQSNVFVWHESLYADLRQSKGKTMACEVSIQAKGGKTFSQLEVIHDIGGVPFVAPAVQQEAF